MAGDPTTSVQIQDDGGRVLRRHEDTDVEGLSVNPGEPVMVHARDIRARPHHRSETGTHRAGLRRGASRAAATALRGHRLQQVSGRFIKCHGIVDLSSLSRACDAGAGRQSWVILLRPMREVW
jgi:hypothetical protein